jgi:Skp family chaperone for outer membrane proteins
MNIKVIDFQILTRYYKNYQDGVNVIELEKQKFLEKLEPIKKEMNAIISAASSGLIMDNNSQQKRAEDFQKLQQEAIEMDREFKIQLKKMSDDLNEKVYDELSEIINEWSVSNDVDLVTGKMEVIYCNDKYDATNSILDILKEKDLYVDSDGNKKES